MVNICWLLVVAGHLDNSGSRSRSTHRQSVACSQPLTAGGRVWLRKSTGTDRCREGAHAVEEGGGGGGGWAPLSQC